MREEEPEENLEARDEDYDFDFSAYEEEGEDQEQADDTIVNKPRSEHAKWKSRFSMTEFDLERLADIKKTCSKYCIQAEAYTQEIGTLWRLFGILGELWEIIRNLYSARINEEVGRIKSNCRKLLKESGEGNIPDKVHNNLLYWRSIMYRLMQISNLSFESERVQGGKFYKTKRKITE